DTETLECSACFETKQRIEVQPTALTVNCTHPSTLCLECVAVFVNTQIRDVAVDQPRCPECQEPLGYTEIQKYADKDLFSRYHRRTIDTLISKIDNFVWCPLGCGTGQVHYPGVNQPLVYCPKDQRHFCLRHGVAWHQDYECEEYDLFLADP
ncbi:hypothetical protein M426DRAFT_37606, partial [Hypoxylon sp. CI-4A]